MLLNLQDVVNIGVAGVIAQGGPSFDFRKKHVEPRYCTDDGMRKCPIGHVLNSTPTSAYEGESVNDESVLDKLREVGFLGDSASDLILVSEFQLTHDMFVCRHINSPDINDSDFLVVFKTNIRDYCEKYELVCPIECT